MDQSFVDPDLQPAEVTISRAYQAVQISDVYFVRVNEDELADTEVSTLEGHEGAESTESYNYDCCLLQRSLRPAAE